MILGEIWFGNIMMRWGGVIGEYEIIMVFLMIFIGVVGIGIGVFF